MISAMTSKASETVEMFLGVLLDFLASGEFG